MSSRKSRRASPTINRASESESTGTQVLGAHWKLHSQAGQQPVAVKSCVTRAAKEAERPRKGGAAALRPLSLSLSRAAVTVPVTLPGGSLPAPACQAGNR